MNVQGADSIVEEYLIHRGFTKTFRCLQKEISEDRTKGFNATRIVEQIFFYIYTFDMESFINMWDFLSKRFFMHLDQEHIMLLGNVKSDLIKYYLVNAIKKSHKEKVAEFFAKYSHEVITESGDGAGLRSWYVLPYMEDPEKDPEFSVFFTGRWSDMLRVTLSNFLSSILLNAPPPKLLLLERWFRSESQQEMRMQMKQASENVDMLLAKQKKLEDRIVLMREAIRDLVSHMHHSHFDADAAGGAGSVRPRRNTTSVGLFETDEEADKKRELMKELGQNVYRLATDCVQLHQQQQEPLGGVGTGMMVEGTKDERERTSSSNSPKQQPHHRKRNQSGDKKRPGVEEVEGQLIAQLQEWLKLMEK